MSGPDLAAARYWLSLALGDLAAARALLRTSEGSSTRVAAQHAQQAAEKALKGAIAVVHESPPRTHDLAFLAQHVTPEINLNDLSLELNALSAALLAGRYPDPQDAPYSIDEASELVEAAQAIVDRVTKWLRASGLVDDLEAR